MIEEKILPITINGSVSSYTHWAYPMAILEQGIQGEETEILNIELSLAEVYKKWEFCTKGVIEEIESSIITYKANRYSKEREFFKYRNLQELDELVIKINSLRYDSANTIFNLLVGDLKVNNQYIQIAIMCKRGIYVAYKGKTQKTSCRFQWKFPLWLKLERNRQLFCASLSYDNVSWDEIVTINVSDILVPHIGYNLNSYDDQIMNWKFTNFIQLKFNREINVFFDYYMTPKRDVRYHYLNNFLEAAYSCKSDILDLFSSLGEACKWNLLRNRYCVLWLDEFYLHGRESFQIDHYRHSNMIYGFSGNEFFILGYSPNGKLIKTREPIDIIEKAYCEESGNSPFETLCYNPNDCEFIYDEEFIIDMIKEYAFSIDSSRRTSNIISRENATYGLDTYSCILAEKLLLRDLRVPYLILEHNRIMEERLRYLQIKNKLYNTDEFNEKIADFHNIVKKSQRILWQVIRSSRHCDFYMENSIEVEFKELFCAEKEFYTTLIPILEKNRHSEF